MIPFAPRETPVRTPNTNVEPGTGNPEPPVTALRRFRTPVPARVRTEEGRPVRVAIDRRGFSGGRVERAAGPWRASGAWWREEAWARDDWDVSLSDGITCRIFRERDADRWFIEGIVD
jgi:protein ImuB